MPWLARSGLLNSPTVYHQWDAHSSTVPPILNCTLVSPYIPIHMCTHTHGETEEVGPDRERVSLCSLYWLAQGRRVCWYYCWACGGTHLFFLAERLSGSERALGGLDGGLGAWGPGGLVGVESSALGWNWVHRRWRRALGVADWWARFRHSGRTRKNLPWEA